jgi:fibro-slime domain-containing protein
MAAPCLCTGRGIASDPYPDLKPTITLNAVIRDFKPIEGSSKGHPDFESCRPSSPRMSLLRETLDTDGKPRFADRAGLAVTRDFRNAQGQPINPKLAGKALKNASASDRKGQPAGTAPPGASVTPSADDAGLLAAGDKAEQGSKNQLTSEEAFRQWYRDVPGVNAAKVVPLVLTRIPVTNRYLFDSAAEEPYKSRSGFFPIDRDLFGNYAASGHNYHFTTEIAAKFVYHQGDRQSLTFTGNDDAWVFIDGKLVLDLGGVHAQCSQTIECDRLNLADGKDHELRIFHAQRHTGESRFRLETTIVMLPAERPRSAGDAD